MISILGIDLTLFFFSYLLSGSDSFPDLLASIEQASCSQSEEILSEDIYEMTMLYPPNLLVSFRISVCLPKTLNFDEYSPCFEVWPSLL